MTPQDIVDHTYTALVRQGGPSTLSDGICAFRGNRGRKCAIGWWIPDELYSKDMEVLGLAKMGQLAELPVFKEHNELLQNLQAAHDTAARLVVTYPGAYSDWQSTLTQEIVRYTSITPTLLEGEVFCG